MDILPLHNSKFKDTVGSLLCVRKSDGCWWKAHEAEHWRAMTERRNRDGQTCLVNGVLLIFLPPAHFSRKRRAAEDRYAT